VGVHDRALVLGSQELLPPALDHEPGGVPEQHGLDVVPAAVDRVDLVVLPQLGEDPVLLLVELGELDQDRARATGDAPAPHAHRDAHRPARLAEGLEPALLLELEVALGGRQQPGPDGHVVVTVQVDQALRLGRDHGVDAADLVADFPADLENRSGARH